jgi:hypothetical protein
MGFFDGIKDFFEENEWAGYALPLATSTLAPGIGGAVGGALSNGLGLDLSPMATQALGNAVFSGGLGALTGGAKGALTGALIGGFTPYAAGLLGSTGPIVGGLPHESQGGYGPDVPKTVDTSSGSGSGGGALSNILGGGGSLSKAIPLLAMAGVMGGALGGGKEKDKGPVVSDEQQAAIDRQNKPLSNVKWDRRRAPMPHGDLTKYGYGPEHEFYKNNRMQAFAEGGDVMGGALSMAHHPEDPYVESRGNPGRSDRIQALLSDNEYVIDAETVALLGDGNPDAGAAALDEMRENIRRHKGGALSRGAISPDAKPALAYLPKGALSHGQ